MHRRCPDSRPVGVGRLRGHRLGFTRFSTRWGGGVADVIPCEHEDVWGLLYEISESDLASLDRHEGYPKWYVRFQAAVEFGPHSIDGAWVYAVRDKRPFVPPSPEYLDILRGAALRLGFPASYVRRLDTTQTQNG